MASEVGPSSTGRVETEDGVEIYYELYESACCDEGASASTSSSGQQQKDEPARVLFIMGVAATCVAWHTQIQALIARGRATGRPVQALAYDNRGVGRSSCPKDRRHYSSVAMARDAAALMAHLGWPCAHVVGFSMGTQIAAKLASSVAPDRVQSLVMVGTAAGGVSSLPRSLHAIRHSLRVMVARTHATLHSTSSSSSASSLAAAAAAALETASSVGSGAAAGGGSGGGASAASAGAGAAEAAARPGSAGGGKGSLAEAAAAGAAARRQKEALVEEYVAHAQSMPPQPKHGFQGHLNTVWQHKLTAAEKDVLRSGKFPVLFIHGAKDKVAPPAYPQRLSRELGAGMVLLPGAHVVMRESAAQVNALLFNIVFGDAPVACARCEVPPIPLHAALHHSGSSGSLGGQQAAAAGGGSSGGAAPPAAAARAAEGAKGRGAADVIAIVASGPQPLAA